MLFSILNSSASTVLAVNLALVALMMAPHVDNRRSTVADDAGNTNPVIGRDGHFANYFNTKSGRLSLAMTLYYIASIFCDLGLFQIKS